MNNSSWCCEKIEELIKKYKKEIKDLKGYSWNACKTEMKILKYVIKDLENILNEE